MWRRVPLRCVGTRLSHSTGILVRDNLTQSLRPLLTRNKAEISWYICGPTVYDDAHLGHARTYVCFDIISRIMSRWHGLDVELVMNVTDIDDKILARAAEVGESPTVLARRFEGRFMEDMAALGVEPPRQLLRVTEHIQEIVRMLQQIESAGRAYTHDGSLWFDTTAHHAYGKLAPPASREPQPVSESGKRDARDFALWKGSKPGEGEAWESPWGAGRPGWHIECSAMCHSVFGEHLDLHSGGIDLAFPHHCNEIAQCEAAFGREGWPTAFIHTGHLNISGLKMSKSLKNFITIRQMLERHSPDDFRLLCLSHSYASTLDFAEEQFTQARAQRQRFEALFRTMTGAAAGTTGFGVKWNSAERELVRLERSTRAAIAEALSRDFNTARALQLLNTFTTKVFSGCWLQCGSLSGVGECRASVCRNPTRSWDAVGAVCCPGAQGLWALVCQGVAGSCGS